MELLKRRHLTVESLTRSLSVPRTEADCHELPKVDPGCVQRSRVDAGLGDGRGELDGEVLAETKRSLTADETLAPSSRRIVTASRSHDCELWRDCSLEAEAEHAEQDRIHTQALSERATKNRSNRALGSTTSTRSARRRRDEVLETSRPCWKPADNAQHVKERVEENTWVRSWTSKQLLETGQDCRRNQGCTMHRWCEFGARDVTLTHSQVATPGSGHILSQ